MRAPTDPRNEVSAEDPDFIRLDDRISSAAFSADPEPDATAQLAWEFENDAEGWTLTNGDTPESENGQLHFSVNGKTAGIVSPPLDLTLRGEFRVDARLAVSGGKQTRLWWNDAGRRDRDESAGQRPGQAQPPSQTQTQGQTQPQSQRRPQGRAAPEAEGGSPWRKTASIAFGIRPGNELQTVVWRTPPPAGGRQHKLSRLRLDPMDGEEGDVSIDSIRFVRREDEYAGRGHGLTQESLGNVVRNALFHRTPSRIEWSLKVPKGARFEVGGGVLDAGTGARFTARIEREGSAPVELFSESVTDDLTWHDWSADLGRFAGRNVRLVLEASSDRKGRIVLWSNPVVRVASTKARKPNVIVYVVDTLRADHLTIYGHSLPTSPSIDRLASEGALFEACASPASWTRPSLASIFTSLSPLSHGAIEEGLGISDGAMTLAEQMRAGGYMTAAFVTSNHAGPLSNMQQGYDLLMEQEAIEALQKWQNGARNPDFSAKTSEMVNRVAIPWLERNADHPFFLYLHVMDPHAPYLPEARYAEMFATGYSGPITGDIDSKHGFRAAHTSEELDHVRSLYDAEIRDLDDRIGELTMALARMGILDNTLFILTSDHGEEFLDHGAFEHGHSLYEESTHVPLLMRLPGRISPIRVKQPVSSLDIMPTVLAVAGIVPNPDVQGRSILPLATGQGETGAAAGRDVISWRMDRATQKNEATVRRGDLKLYLTFDKGSQLYDLSADPLEKNDLSKARPEETRELESIARRWNESRPRVVAPDETKKVIVDMEEQEWLRSLGYIK